MSPSATYDWLYFNVDCKYIRKAVDHFESVGVVRCLDLHQIKTPPCIYSGDKKKKLGYISISFTRSQLTATPTESTCNSCLPACRQMLVRRERRGASPLCSPSAQSISEHWGRCRATLIDSSRLFPAIKLSWKINFCILCKLKYATLSWRLYLSSAQFTTFSPSLSLSLSAPLSCFVSVGLLFCLFIHLSFPCWYSLPLSVSPHPAPLAHTDRNSAHSNNWLRWNAIMHQKPIVMKSRRTFIISIKTDCQCQRFPHNIIRTSFQHKLSQCVSLLRTGKLLCLSYWVLCVNLRSHKREFTS